MADTVGLPLIAAGVLAHAATNLDNLVALLAIGAALGRGRALVAWGGVQVLAIGAAVVMAEGAEWTVGARVGWLGVIPILVGLRMLRQRWRGGAAPEHPPAPTIAMLPAAVLFLSMSGDSLAVFTPLLADTAGGLEVYVLVGAVVSMLSLGAVSLLLPRSAGWWSTVAARMEAAVPWVMMLAGIYVLVNTATD